MYIDEKEVVYSTDEENNSETYVFVPTGNQHEWYVSLISKTYFDEDGDPCFEHKGLIFCASKEPGELFKEYSFSRGLPVD